MYRSVHELFEKLGKIIAISKDASDACLLHFHKGHFMIFAPTSNSCVALKGGHVARFHVCQKTGNGLFFLQSLAR